MQGRCSFPHVHPLQPHVLHASCCALPLNSKPSLMTRSTTPRTPAHTNLRSPQPSPAHPRACSVHLHEFKVRVGQGTEQFMHTLMGGSPGSSTAPGAAPTSSVPGGPPAPAPPTPVVLLPGYGAAAGFFFRCPINQRRSPRPACERVCTVRSSVPTLTPLDDPQTTHTHYTRTMRHRTPHRHCSPALQPHTAVTHCSHSALPWLQEL